MEDTKACGLSHLHGAHGRASHRVLRKEGRGLCINSRRVTSLAPGTSVTETDPGLLVTGDEVTLKKGLKHKKIKPYNNTGLQNPTEENSRFRPASQEKGNN